jgi:hypothetical protein
LQTCITLLTPKIPTQNSPNSAAQTVAKPAASMPNPKQIRLEDYLANPKDVTQAGLCEYISALAGASITNAKPVKELASFANQIGPFLLSLYENWGKNMVPEVPQGLPKGLSQALSNICAGLNELAAIASSESLDIDAQYRALKDFNNKTSNCPSDAIQSVLNIYKSVESEFNNL